MSLNLYSIALTLLGLNNDFVNNVVRTLTDEEIIALFDGKCTELQLLHNIDFEKYSKVFNSKAELQNSIIKSQHIINVNKTLKIKAVSIDNRFYPKNLKSIKNAPPVLYIRGHGIYRNEEKAVGCSGTRTPTVMGIRAANSIVTSLAQEGFTVISGLAEGIDTQCHKACLESDGETIAVMAHGLDMIYPQINEKLASNILERKGTLVSEYPVETKPDRFRFVQRDRLITGLSKGTIIFEAKEKSGTMHTAEFAKAQNRKIFCPVPIENVEQTKGIAKLLNEKIAIPIPNKNSYDIIITQLGYKIRNKEKALQVKSINIERLFSKANIDHSIIEKYIIGDDVKRTSAEINAKLYDEFKAVIKSKNLSVKDTLNAFIMSIVNGNDKKG